MTPPPTRGAALRTALADLLADVGPLTRAELAARSGAAPSTVVDAVRAMLAAGVLEEVAGGRAGRSGRPSAVLRPVAHAGHTGVVVVDRREMRAAVVDGQGRVSAHGRCGFDPRDADGPFTRAAGLLASLGGVDLRCVVVGVTFPVHDGRRSWPARTRALRTRHGEPWAPWTRVDLRRAFTDTFGVPVLVENDANLAALGEARAGAGMGVTNMIGLTVASALGAGIVINQQLVRGAAGFAGELAHTQLDPRGALCSCGSRGCLATRTDWDQVVGLIDPAFHDDLTHDDVLALAADGDAGVRHMLVDHGELIGQVLAPACALLNPELICVDARLGAAVHPVIEGITASLTRQAPGAAVESVRVVSGQLDGNAEYVGAAALAETFLRARR